jgi:uncharacterized protein DUF6894
MASLTSSCRDWTPRFYFSLASNDAYIPDDSGKELATLNDAYEHARKLIHKILVHVRHVRERRKRRIVLRIGRPSDVFVL